MVSYQEIFNRSYWRAIKAVKDGKGFFDTFYDKFISSSLEIREKFKDTDMDVQKHMLTQSLVQMSRFSVIKVADHYIERIAKIHSKNGKNVEPHLYDIWLNCLIDTVKEYDPVFNDKVELAWRKVLSAGITYMRFKYDK